MPQMPPPVTDHPLVDLIARAWQDGARGRHGDEPPHRWHLGGSQLGKECPRALWYSFRWVQAPEFPGRILRLFDRGDIEEPRIVADLEAVGATVAEVDPGTGAQWRFGWHGGHLGMSLDGLVHGLPAAAGFDPDDVLVCEFKTASAKRWAEMVRKGVATSDPVYWSQCQLGIHAAGVRRALFVAVNKDTEALYVQVIEREDGVAERLLAKGARIVDAAQPPERIAEDASDYRCRWCDFRDVCHYGKAAEVNCRTCAHSTPDLNGQTGDWTCAQGQTEIEDCLGCERHVFNPGLVRLEAVESDGSTVLYRDGAATIGNGSDALSSDAFAAALDDSNPLLP